MEHYDWNDGWLFAPVFTPPHSYSRTARKS